VNVAMIDWVIVGGYLALSLGIRVAGKRYIGTCRIFCCWPRAWPVHRRRDVGCHRDGKHHLRVQR